MVKQFICFVLLGVASGANLPYGGIISPSFGGIGNGIIPYNVRGIGHRIAPYNVRGIGNGYYGRPYSGYGYPLFYNGGVQNGMSQFSGDERSYGNLNSNGLTHNSLGSTGAMANVGGNGFAGGQRYANHQQGLGGHHSTDFGGNFNNGAAGFKLSNGFSDVSGQGNIGGFNNAGHNKGHKTTGFHKSYNNVETGRNTKFVDEEHDMGGQNFGQEYGKNFANAGSSGFRGIGGNGQYGTNHHFDQAGQNGLSGGSFNGANFGGHGANNFYNSQDLSAGNTHLGNNLNQFGQGYSGMSNQYGMGHSFLPHSW